MSVLVQFGSYPNVIFPYGNPNRPKSVEKSCFKNMTSQQKPINNDEKLIIIKSYDEGIPPRIISKQIGKTVDKKFYSRWKFNKDLPPKEKQNRSDRATGCNQRERGSA
jgi:hypothetical protein